MTELRNELFETEPHTPHLAHPYSPYPLSTYEPS